MRKKFEILLIFILFIFITGCKNYSLFNYSSFIEFFNNKSGFQINDKTLNYEDIYQRCIEVNKDDIQFIYYEFKTEEEAKNYVKKNYDNSNFKTKIGKKYSISKSNTSGYFYLVQKENVIVIGNTENAKSKKELKSIFKEFLK